MEVTLRWHQTHRMLLWEATAKSGLPGWEGLAQQAGVKGMGRERATCKAQRGQDGFSDVRGPLRGPRTKERVCCQKLFLPWTTEVTPGQNLHGNNPHSLRLTFGLMLLG